MSVLKRPIAAVAATIAVVLLAGACTPEQIATLRQVDQGMNTLLADPAVEEWALAQPDGPVPLADGRKVLPDGSVIEAPPARELVNGLKYSHGDLRPAWTAFTAVALHRGWTQQQVDSWQRAFNDIVFGESGGCPNVRNGARLASADGCVISRQGKGSDSGFAQLTSVHHGGDKWACVDLGICGANSVIASPWNSMTVFVALLERSGNGPWCYNNWARRYHRGACNNPGMDVPYFGAKP